MTNCATSRKNACELWLSYWRHSQVAARYAGRSSGLWIKIFMGSMHGPLLVDEAILDRIFAKGDRIIAVHAEDQGRIRQRREQFKGIINSAIHSQIQWTNFFAQAAKRFRGERFAANQSIAPKVQNIGRDLV